MLKETINIVWIKRDLRTQDHLPFLNAEEDSIHYIPIFLFEPSIIQHPDTSIRHLQFQYQSLLVLNKLFKPFNGAVQICYAEAVEVFNHLIERYQINKVFSYQESGIQLTYQRDKALAILFKKHQIVWKEFQRDGIIRGIKNRDGWDKKWFETMHSPITINQYQINKQLIPENSFPLPSAFQTTLENYSKLFQPAGELNVFRYLESFVESRGKFYQKHISKPLLSRYSCARISPYLAWGNISIKQAYQLVYRSPEFSKHKNPFNAMLTRLKWHCHFIQKFEVECSYESNCINTAYEQVEHTTRPDLIQAWKDGNTGYPLVDACMRSLKATGWINFRMRAMLVSFFCHNLLQDWRDGAYYLAQLFLDYEPGIHYPQFQMQAGTTGINTIRIYNPVKQSQDQDPTGEFIKKWVPELEKVPLSFLHQPWSMTEIDQQLCGTFIGKDYPAPLVDYQQNAKIAQQTLWGLRKTEDVKKENRRILDTHTRKKKTMKQPKSNETN